MTTPPNPHDPKSGQDPSRQGQDPARKGGGGPNNPLPGEPGGPSTSGHIEGEEHDEGHDKDRADKDRGAPPPSKR
jgi:hypothetical protein